MAVLSKPEPKIGTRKRPDQKNAAPVDPEQNSGAAHAFDSFPALPKAMLPPPARTRGFPRELPTSSTAEKNLPLFDPGKTPCFQGFRSLPKTMFKIISTLFRTLAADFTKSNRPI